MYKTKKTYNFYILKTYMLKYYSSYLQARQSDKSMIFILYSTLFYLTFSQKLVATH